jgi:putative two-component system response regulator
MSAILGEERTSTLTPEWLRVRELEEEALALRSSVICAFNQLLDLKDLNTGVHSTRLAEWGMRVAQELGIDGRGLLDIEVAALLHDIGKMGVPDAILRKPGRLTEEEFAIVKKHPEYGWAVLRQVPGFQDASLFVLHHHENFDGKGYPAGLKELEIPMGSRIVRPYRQGLSFDEATRRLILSSGTQFDPIIVQCFLRIAQAGMPSVFEAAGTTVSAAL